MMITAPYNFVPLNKKVVSAYWAEHISHDQPFQNQVSGSFDIEITAGSPIYIRNGGKTVSITNNQGEQEQKPDPEFNNLNGKYFVPGSSIKGMLRSVLEIMSFGKMEDKVTDTKYSLRDFQNNSLYNKAELSKEAEVGWLRLAGDVFYLTPCGRPGRISHKELDQLSGPNPISKHYQNKNNLTKDFQKSAKHKYEQFPFTKTGHTFKHKEEEDDGIGRKKYGLDLDGKSKGIIVFTGQPGARQEPNKGKQYEFIFFDYSNSEIPIPKNHPIIKNFFYAYYDHERNQQSEDWKWRKKQLESGESIPVFYRLIEPGKEISSDNIKDFGLSLLYKINYNYSVKDSVINYQKLESLKRDLSEAIFGYISQDKKSKEQSLKGRVWVGHAFAEGNPAQLPIVKEVLAGPKATYYPNYIEQNEANGTIKGRYSTFMDRNAVIRGYKRYPVRKGDEIRPNPAPINPKTGKPNEKITTEFAPLAAGTKFSFTVSYHNLKKLELGALVSAITFHLSEGYYHSLGMGKPLGYGKISLNIRDQHNLNLQNYVSEFEAFMNWSLGNNKPEWHLSEQLQELFVMARPSDQSNKKLQYMATPAEFAEAKGKKKDDPKYALSKYSAISGQSAEISSLLTIADLENHARQFEADKVELTSTSADDHGKEWANFHLNKIKRELEDKISSMKSQLIQEIEEIKTENKGKRSEVLKNEVDARSEEIRQQTLAKGLDLSGVKTNSRVFDDISKKVSQYLKKGNFEVLPTSSDEEALIQVLKLNIEKMKNFKIRPLEENPYFIKISKWIGMDKTRKFFEDLN